MVNETFSLVIHVMFTYNSVTSSNTISCKKLKVKKFLAYIYVLTSFLNDYTCSRFFNEKELIVLVYSQVYNHSWTLIFEDWVLFKIWDILWPRANHQSPFQWTLILILLKYGEKKLKSLCFYWQNWPALKSNPCV